MPRIAIAGFQHETNSRGIGRAGLAEFEMADSWPGLLTGPEVIDGTRGMNLPIAGFAAAAEEGGAELVPILWCAAEPSGPVTDHAFAEISGRILEGLHAAGPIDGLYLDLHGAMITESEHDGEAALLGRIRALTGPDLPIAISLDMHANLSARLVGLVDAITIYKTYPHLDMGQTGARAWARMTPLLEGGARPAKAFRQAPFLIPLHAQETGAGPARALYAALPDEGHTHVEMALGFTAGDTPDVGPSVVALAPDQAQADAKADAALARLVAARAAFDCALTDPDAAIAAAMKAPPGPVILADVQDNPGAGASSDTTGLLRALISARAPRTLIGLMHDPTLADAAHEAGLGQVFDGRMGGRSGLTDDSPYAGRFRVEALSDGAVRYTGAMYGGGVAQMGRSAALSLPDSGADITVVVTSIRNQCLDLAQFRHLGLEPSDARIVVVKSTAHFRADFGPIAAMVIPVAAPGLFDCAISTLHDVRR